MSFSSFLDAEDSDFAEFYVVIMAMEFAKEKNFDKIWLETGSSFVMNACNNHALVLTI